nr:MAG: hypothetical protein [Bacteriophage sp.]
MPFIAISPIAIPFSLNPLRGVLLISLLIFLVLNLWPSTIKAYLTKSRAVSLIRGLG